MGALNTKCNRLILDGLLISLGFFLAFQLRYDGSVPPFHLLQFWAVFLPLTAGRLLTNTLFGLNQHKWRYVSMVELRQIVFSYSAFSLVLLVLRVALPPFSLFRLGGSIIVIELLISLSGALGIRLLRRSLYQWEPWRAMESQPRRVLLVGAGSHGVTVAKEMIRNKGIKLVGFLDDDPRKLGSVLASAKVLGPTSALPEVVRQYQVDDVLVCIPPSVRKNFILNGDNPSFRTSVVPTLEEILQAENLVGEAPAAGGNHNHAARPTLLSRKSPEISVRNKNILITGGAGFIGSALAEKLAAHNQVTLVDLSFRNRPIEFTSLVDHRNVRVIEGNLLNGVDLSICQEAQMVVHAAGVVGVGRVCNSGAETLDTNYVGTSVLLQALRNSRRLERFIFFSTSEVFGVHSFRVDEKSPPSLGPISEARWSYAIAKLAGEHLVKSYYRETGMPVVIVRPFNIFGPRRTGDHAMLRFITNALRGQPLEVYGDGSQVRSWCYIDDFCSALLAMLQRPEAIGEDFNIGNSGNMLTIYELARRIVELTGNGAPIVLKEHPFPDIEIRVPSMAKAHKLLGYAPCFDLESALALTIDWYRDHLDRLATDQLGPAAVAASASPA